MIQQAQQATVTGMGLGDGARGATVQTIAGRAPQQRPRCRFSSQVSTIFVDGCN